MFVVLLWIIFVCTVEGSSDTKLPKQPNVIEIVQPFSVWQDLFSAGLIPDPYWSDNDVRLRNLSYVPQSVEFNFTIPDAVLARPLLRLGISGIGAVTEVFLNDQRIASTSNQFHLHSIDITSIINKSQTNQTLRIEFLPSPNYAANASSRYNATYGYSIPPACPPKILRGECHISFLRTRQSSYGWDGGPTFPPLGLWFPITLTGYSGCVIENFNVMPQKFEKSRSGWDLLVDFNLICEKVGLVSQVALDSPELAIKWNSTFVSRTTTEIISVSIEVPRNTSVKLWWPNQYGKQCLYLLTASINGTHQTQRSFGFRHIELVQDPIQFSNGSKAGLSFYFKINSVPIFLKGANWVPNDSFLSNVSCAELRWYFTEMVAANFNSLRICGIDIYENDCFYDLADEFGVLIWHDLMFGNALYPVDPQFLQSVRQEISDQIGRIKSHPSILVWAGNNEIEAGFSAKWWDAEFDAPKSQYVRDYLRLFNETIRPLIQHLDPTRPFLQSTPSNGAMPLKQGTIPANPYSELYGDTHFYQYDQNPWNVSIYPVPRCAVEFGYQSLPAISTLRTALPASELKYFSDGLSHREHHPDGQMQMLLEVIANLPLNAECSYLSNKTEAAICLGVTMSLESLIYLTQINQAMGVKTQVENYRRMKSTTLEDGRGKTMCSLYWQLNDIWQAPTWSSIDYSGQLKMLHHYATKFFAPVMVSLYLDNQKLYGYIVSDSVTPLHNLTLIVDYFQWQNFTPIRSDTQLLTIVYPLKSQLVYKSGNLNNQSSGAVARARLFDGASQVEHDAVVFLANLTAISPSKFGSVKIADVKAISETSLVITLEADGPAPFVWIECLMPNIRGRFSDNGFLMVESRVSVTFNVTGSNSSPIPFVFHDAFMVTSLRDVYS